MKEEDKNKNAIKNTCSEGVRGFRPKRVKIKIKERVSKKHSSGMPIAAKVLAIILAAALGFIAGGRIVARYFTFWSKSEIKYRSPKEKPSPEVQAGKAFYTGK
ncbi:hypothetical protein ACFL42_00960 [Candidatus Omnitrophota bacterium]